MDEHVRSIEIKAIIKKMLKSKAFWSGVLFGVILIILDLISYYFGPSWFYVLIFIICCIIFALFMRKYLPDSDNKSKQLGIFMTLGFFFILFIGFLGRGIAELIEHGYISSYLLMTSIFSIILLLFIGKRLHDAIKLDQQIINENNPITNKND